MNIKLCSVRTFLIFQHILCALFLMYFSLWGLIKLDLLPGLHGDEAWFGLRSLDINSQGIRTLESMNSYTGIFQQMSSAWVFQIFGAGIFQLRVAGVIFNIFSLLIIYKLCFWSRNMMAFLIFLLIFSQSAFFLSSMRVAWEVNSLTLLFLAILLFSLKLLYNPLDKRKQAFGYFLFLLVNIAGTYNHIIFSCISLSAFVGLVLWTWCFHDFRYKDLFHLSLVNLINLVLLALIMKFWIEGLFAYLRFFILVPVVLLLAFETVFLIRLKSVILDRITSLPRNCILINSIFCIFLAVFCFFHGKSFFYLLSNYKILLHTYSFDSGTVEIIIFIVNAICLLSYSLYLMYRDLTFKRRSIVPFFILCYLGLFNMYTVECSFRYYLAIFFIFSMYVAWQSNRINKVSRVMVVTMLLSTLAMNVDLYQVFFLSKPIRANLISNGSKEPETSAHFLPKEPIIQFLKENKVGCINCTQKEFFFIVNPVLFYKKIAPWPEKKVVNAIIDYDYQNYGNGYIMSLDSSKNSQN
jgi:hypothetical protein